MPDTGFHLLTLGGLGLVGPDGSRDESLHKRRRKLALLAVLAIEARPLSRDCLTSVFWAQQEVQRARHSLSDALSHLRRVLGRGAIAARQHDVWLRPDARVRVDVLELVAAANTGDTAAVVAAYTGALLDGVHVQDAPQFNQWVARERSRLADLFQRACAARCLALARQRQWDACASLAARWLECDARSADAALYLLNALKAPATREADALALREYECLGRRLRTEHAVEVDGRVRLLAERIAARLRAPAATAAPQEPARPPRRWLQLVATE